MRCYLGSGMNPNPPAKSFPRSKVLSSMGSCEETATTTLPYTKSQSRLSLSNSDTPHQIPSPKHKNQGKSSQLKGVYLQKSRQILSTGHLTFRSKLKDTKLFVKKDEEAASHYPGCPTWFFSMATGFSSGLFFFSSLRWRLNFLETEEAVCFKSCALGSRFFLLSVENCPTKFIL